MQKITSLTLIDEILGGLCRGVSTKDKTFGCYLKDKLPPLKEVCHLLDAKVSSPLIPGMVTLNLGSRSVPHALKLARASLEVMIDHTSKIISLPIFDQLSAYRNMIKWSLDDFVANAKFMVSYPMARFLKNEIPSRPSSFLCHPFVYTGRIKRILKNRAVSFTKKNASLFQGILQGVKRGAEVVPESFIHKAMVKHRAALTKPPKGFGPNSHPSRSIGVNWFEATELDQYFNRFFKNFRPPKPDLFEASPAASFESKRSEGGGREYLREYFSGSLEQTPFSKAVYRLLDSENFGNDLISMYEERPGKVVEVRGRVTWNNFRELAREIQSEPKHRNVMVSAVLEPLKVRLITKGETFKYYLSRFYQKGLWNFLQKFPQFSLTGRPLELSDFYSLLDREKKLGLDFPFWVSGDYSAATDNLKIFYTKMAFEASLDRCSDYSDELKDNLRAVLYEQEIHYPAKQNIGDLDPVTQTTGQLMGSTLSFPILCTVNLCTYWLSLERFLGRRIKLSELPVLVNGDDILFRTNPEHYSFWRELVSEVGFELSQGKNYVHSSFFTVNSTGFIQTRSDWIEEIPYLNAGLLTGQSKLTGRLSDRLMPIWDYYNTVIDGANDKNRAHKRFLHYHKENIRSLTKDGNYSLFVDPLLGGLGFKFHPDLEGVYLTPFQKRFAYYLRSLLKQPFEGEFKDLSPFRGLIHKTKSRIIMKRLYHWGNFILKDKTTPLNKNEREIREGNLNIKESKLALGYSLDQPELVVRPPDRRILEGFRSSNSYELKFHKCLEFPYRFIELLKV